MSRRDGGWGLCAAVVVVACSASTTGPAPSEGGSGPGGAGGGTTQPAGGSGGGTECSCLPGPHNDLIYVLSDAGEIWSYDPGAKDFSYQVTVLCDGDQPYSMAVDHTGRAWILMASNGLVFTVDTGESGDCEVAPYTPHQTSFDLFGMAFAGELGGPSCPPLYLHSYTGTGPFAEGPDAGVLARVDPLNGELSVLGAIDYDGGELAGTADGRLFAFAGVGPAKLIEYDRDSAAALGTTPLVGFSKTNASAFAFFAGDIYFFTEAIPDGCWACLESTCPLNLDACSADALCAEQLQCALEQGEVFDQCGGLMPQAMIDCLVTGCGTSCLIPSSQKVSQVSRLDYGNSETVLYHDAAPIRIVGASNSVCVPDIPR